ncbi:MAG: outer membrane protein assembly factor BamE [Planctomycetota bacterium]|nr:MAG: outer membrane protein assembly factor BamE [Planctomycetota bacterium]
MSKRVLWILPFFFLFTGCVYFHSVGKNGVDWGEIRNPGLIKKGATQDEVLQLYGEPDQVRTTAKGETWVYHLARSFYIVVYGEAEYKDLEVNFDQTGKVRSFNFFFKGKSMSLFIPGTVVR